MSTPCARVNARQLGLFSSNRPGGCNEDTTNRILVRPRSQANGRKHVCCGEGCGCNVMHFVGVQDRRVRTTNPSPVSALLGLRRSALAPRAAPNGVCFRQVLIVKRLSQLVCLWLHVRAVKCAPKGLQNDC